MAWLGYACALVLTAVFVWAAAAKLARPGQTAAGFRALGMPGPTVLALVVPAVELLVAVSLAASPRLGGVVALGLLAVFSAVLVRALQAGITSGCACFGTTAAHPLSTRDLARNGLLAVLALAAALLA